MFQKGDFLDFLKEISNLQQNKSYASFYAKGKNDSYHLRDVNGFATIINYIFG